MIRICSRQARPDVDIASDPARRSPVRRARHAGIAVACLALATLQLAGASPADAGRLHVQFEAEYDPDISVLELRARAEHKGSKPRTLTVQDVAILDRDWLKDPDRPADDSIEDDVHFSNPGSMAVWTVSPGFFEASLSISIDCSPSREGQPELYWRFVVPELGPEVRTSNIVTITCPSG